MELSTLVRYLLTATTILIPATLFVLQLRARNNNASNKTSPPPPLPPPTTVASLRIYPIKSCRGITVRSTRLLHTGLELDRQWMFVSAEDKKFLTIRQISKMTLIDTALQPLGDAIAADTQLVISIRGADPPVAVAVPARPSQEHLAAHATRSTAIIWGAAVEAWEYGPELTGPISAFLGRDVRLVYKGGATAPRRLRGNGAPQVLGRTGSVGFADVLPVQIASEASMADLNRRLKEAGEDEMEIERFRPNIVVRGTEPWAEDTWKTVRIGGEGKGELVIDVQAHCARCRVPNVDPNTGIENKQQPWDTLMGYRRIDEGIKWKPCFGMICVPRNEGDIEVGMKLRVTETTNEHRYITGM
ncbi:MOSC domain protein [Lineolata rhizophorae]|uniref:MOSC domain protein n=1 Tax=Lineolata rhizophorae TaxID=578093 RepID=A0A6A6P581_9PEZI|nr:MOSC domain protein [Lineolata rhizophorae]